MEKFFVNLLDFKSIEWKANEIVELRFDDKDWELDQLAIKRLHFYVTNYEYPARIKKLIEFGAFSGESNLEEKLKGFFQVAKRACLLLKAGFHLRTVTSMLGEAGGRGCCFGGLVGNDFDLKYHAIQCDKEGARVDLWGTKYLLPIDMLYFWLIDFPKANGKGLSLSSIEESELVRYELSIYNDEKQKLEEFIKFCFYKK